MNSLCRLSIPVAVPSSTINARERTKRTRRYPSYLRWFALFVWIWILHRSYYGNGKNPPPHDRWKIYFVSGRWGGGSASGGASAWQLSSWTNTHRFTIPGGSWMHIHEETRNLMWPVLRFRTRYQRVRKFWWKTKTTTLRVAELRPGIKTFYPRAYQ